MAAAVTKRIKLATGICLVIERDPIVLAKEVAASTSLWRPRHPRNRRRLERRGDGEPRHGVQNAVEAAPRARRGNEGDLAERGGLVPGGIDANLIDLVLSEARAEAAPADPARRPRRDGPEACRRILRWLAADLDDGRRPEEADRRAAPAGPREGPRSEVDLHLCLLVATRPPGDRRLRRDGSGAGDLALPSESPEKVLPILDGYAKLIR